MLGVLLSLAFSVCGCVPLSEITDLTVSKLSTFGLLMMIVHELVYKLGLGFLP